MKKTIFAVAGALSLLGAVLGPNVANSAKPNIALINADVDQYPRPGGKGSVLRVLRAGQRVGFSNCRSDKWCYLTKPAGWVWEDYISICAFVDGCK